MAIGEVLKIGDVVVINIPDDNWSWGFKPVKKQKGTLAKVLGFGEICYSRIQNFGRKPGVYVNHAWLNVKVGRGEPFPISSSFVDLKDKDQYVRRVKKFRKNGGLDNANVWLRDLPEMKFWEGDIVKVVNGRHPWEGIEFFKISQIEYGYLGQMRNDGVTPMPEYSLEPEGKGGGRVSINESQLELVARGNVWKHFNGVKPVFKDLNEEAEFFILLGKTREVRNPISGLYSWTKDEILKAIQDGTVDGFTGGSRIGTVLFNDRDLGKRVAEATLKGFGLGA